MSGTGKRGADRLNMIGIVVVGICGAVLTYVSIILLEAFYMADTSAIDRERDHENPNSLRSTVHAAALTNIGEYRSGTTPDQKFIPIDRAMVLVVADAQKDPSLLVPGVGPSRTPNMLPQYGRAAALPAPAPTEPAPVDPTAPPTAPVDPAAPVDPNAAPVDGTAPAPAVAPADGTTPASIKPPAKAEPVKPAAEPAKPPAGGNAP